MIKHLSTLDAWLSYIQNIHHQTIDLGLERVLRVAERLQCLNRSIPHVVVTGTNGKGSCVALLESIYSTAGYRVASYTSPHLLHYTERIRLQGKCVAESLLLEAFCQVERCRQGKGYDSGEFEAISLTFFEFTFLVALTIFSQWRPDVILLEVGIGGRLDAVNIVDADVAVISSVDLDHQQLLGPTREHIGFEKAGIFRPHSIAVSGECYLPYTVWHEAWRQKVQLNQIHRDFSYHRDHEAMQWSWHAVSGRSWSALPIPSLALRHAAVALMVIDRWYRALPVDEIALRDGLKKAKLPGRLQSVHDPQTGIHCLLDVAHNPAAARWLADFLKRQPFCGRTWAVMGLASDKDAVAMLSPLLNQIDDWCVAQWSQQHSMRKSFQAVDLKRTLLSLGCHQDRCRAFKSVLEAYRYALTRCQPQDRIVVFGSFVVVADVVRYREQASLPSVVQSFKQGQYHAC